MRGTRLSVCRRKLGYGTREAAIAAAVIGGWLVRPYQCEHCRRFHLTSRRRGGWIPRVIREAARAGQTSSVSGADGL